MVPSIYWLEYFNPVLESSVLHHSTRLHIFSYETFKCFNLNICPVWPFSDPPDSFFFVLSIDTLAWCLRRCANKARLAMLAHSRSFINYFLTIVTMSVTHLTAALYFFSRLLAKVFLHMCRTEDYTHLSLKQVDQTAWKSTAHTQWLWYSESSFVLIRVGSIWCLISFWFYDLLQLSPSSQTLPMGSIHVQPNAK